DEALRLRRRTSDRGTEAFLTYKGPKIDPTTKTRREIDLPLGISGGSSVGESDIGKLIGKWTDLLESLGYRAVGDVRKIRGKTHIVWRGTRVEVSLDTLPQLRERGASGIFCELEILVPEMSVDTAIGSLSPSERPDHPDEPGEDDATNGSGATGKGGESDGIDGSVAMDEVDVARTKLFALAEELGLPTPDRQCRRSYLELILEIRRDAGEPGA
ncbi:MAG: CYTH domain-containing protein, partial [Planctomycetia bacterium]|nr:CYTH domain-containing protein [Planctomycetia bacterium]